MISKSSSTKFANCADINNLHAKVDSEWKLLWERMPTFLTKGWVEKCGMLFVRPLVRRRVFLRAKVRFMRSHRSILRRIGKGGDFEGRNYYECLTDEVRRFLRLKLVLLFATTDSSPSAVLPCLAVSSEESPGLSNSDLRIDWRSLPVRFRQHAGGLSSRVKPFFACSKALEGAHSRDVPRNSKMLICFGHGRVKATVIYSGEVRNGIPKGYVEDVLKKTIGMEYVQRTLVSQKADESKATERVIMCETSHDYLKTLR